MKPETAKKLLKLNHELYEKEAISWDKTRQKLWEWPVIEELKKIKQGSNILDLGCGNARLYEAISRMNNQKSNINYLGIDPSKKLIGINKKRYCYSEQCEQSEESQSDPLTSLRMTPKFEVGDGLTLKDKNKYDFVFCLAVLHHIPSEKLQLKFLKNIRNSLKKEGKLILSVWNRWQPRYRKYFVFSNHKSQISNYKQITNFNHQNLKHKFELDPNDTIVPWKQSGNFRFIHAFTDSELKKLAQKAEFKNIKTFYGHISRNHPVALVQDDTNKKEKSTKEKGLNIYLNCNKG